MKLFQLFGGRVVRSSRMYKSSAFMVDYLYCMRGDVSTTISALSSLHWSPGVVLSRLWAPMGGGGGGV